MKNITVYLIFLICFQFLSAGQMKMEGFYETEVGKTLDSEEFKWNMWDPNFYIETRFYANPFTNTNMYLKFYSDKDNDNYKTKSFNTEAIFTEANISFRQERNENGFNAVLFSRGGGNYWLDGTMLEVLRPDEVRNDDNSQGVKFDIWHRYKGSISYLFADMFQRDDENIPDDDVHLFRLRQAFIKEKIRAGLFFLRKNYKDAEEKDYNQVVAGDLKVKLLNRYFITAEMAFSDVPSQNEIEELNKEYKKDGVKGFFKSNVASKIEVSGFRIGNANFGYWSFTPGIFSFGDTYRNYMGNNTFNQYGFWINSYFLVPQRAITLSLNYSHYQKYIPKSNFVYTDSINFYEVNNFDKRMSLYSEAYIEFINGFKGKIFLNINNDNERIINDDGLLAGWKQELHHDLFTELSVENNIAKLLTQFKIKNIGETWETQIVGLECSANLSENWRFFARGMIANDRVGSRHTIFCELQYRISGNTELYLQYGPSSWGSWGLVNDDSFASGGEMKDEIKLILKGWF